MGIIFLSSSKSKLILESASALVLAVPFLYTMVKESSKRSRRIRVGLEEEFLWFRRDIIIADR